MSQFKLASPKEIIEYGIPQGAILSPQLYLIYTSKLPSCLETLPRFFADDTALLIAGKTSAHVQATASSELLTIWLLMQVKPWFQAFLKKSTTVSIWIHSH